jgi:hypothetical protein
MVSAPVLVLQTVTVVTGFEVAPPVMVAVLL